MDRRLFLGGIAAAGTAGLMAGCAGAEQGAISVQSLPSDITSMSASALSSAIKNKYVSCKDVMQAYLEQIHKYNPTYNAIVSLRTDDELLREAEQADADLSRGLYHGWMHGMPHAVKDLSDVKGMLTTSGSPILKNNLAKQDAIFVNRIRKQGAIFIGKTNVPEFGLGSQTYNPIFGITRNAYDPNLIAGGSSGGAACGLATHMLPTADGSDMMGSLRNPAAYNNVIGFRPSQGRIPRKDKSLFYQQLGYEGPMGRNVEDTWRLLQTMAGYDARSPLSLRDSLYGPDAYHGTKNKPIKLGWMGDFNGYLPMELGIKDLCRQALVSIADESITVSDCQPEYDMFRLWETWLTLRHWTIASSAKALYDNSKLRPLLKPEAVWEIEGGLNQTGLDISQAAVARSDWYKALDKLFEEYDFLVLPSAQVFPFETEIHWPKKIGDVAMDTYHRWMEVVIGGTLSGCPVVNVPAGFDVKGRPMGMQIIGRMGADEQLLAFARTYEVRTNYLSKRPKLVVS